MLGIRTLIRNFTLRSERTWLAIAGGDSWAGKPVTPATAMGVAAFWACVRKISQTIGTLPLGLYERRDDGGRDARADHPLYRLLHDQPNADQTAVEFWEGVTACLCVWGNAFAEKVTANGRVIALHLLRPDLMSVDRDRNGMLTYRYSDPHGHRRDFTEDEIFHVRGFGFGDVLGLSPIAYGRQTLSTAMAATEAAARTFRNGMRPGGFFTYDKTLTDPQREQARKVLIEPYQGSENAAKIGILEAGFKWQDVAMPAKDAELLLSRKHDVEEICSLLDVPPILIGHSSQGQTMWGSGIEQIMIGWYTTGLRPYLIRIEQAIKRSLIAPAERGTLYAEFTVEGLLRADSKGRGEMYSKLVQVGAITPNQICDKENLPRFEGGDVHLVNSSLAPLDRIGGTKQVEKMTPHYGPDGRIAYTEKETVRVDR